MRLHSSFLGALALFLGLSQSELLAQDCLNDNQNPTATIQPNAQGTTTVISTCSSGSQYSAIGPVLGGGDYEFKITAGGYITVREGTPDGPVIAQGTSPVVATPTQDGTLYAHWSSTAECGTIIGCRTTSVKLMLNCTQPVANITPVDDCPNNEFSLNVNIISLGDGNSVDLTYSVNGGAEQTITGLGLGVETIGPFTIGQSVDVAIAHESSPFCTIHFNDLTQEGTCPVIIDCDDQPLQQAYCYDDLEQVHWMYQSSNEMALGLYFSSGSIESNVGDRLRVYDGLDNNGDMIYENGPLATDLTGLQVIALSGSIYMELTTNGSGSCASNLYEEWNWEVSCLDCSGPTVNFEVLTDCETFEFNVEVEISDMGDADELTITNNGGAAPIIATSAGTYTVGPFVVNTPVVVTVEHPLNNLCNAASGPLVNPECPQPVFCGQEPLEETYCYSNNDAHHWIWQATEEHPLILVFSAGTIESNSWDHLRIYNGPNNAAPLLYENPTGTTNLTGVEVIASSGTIYMEMSSDGSVSCASTSSYATWEWQVGCLDCTMAAASFTVVPDCDEGVFNVDVDITTMGDQAEFEITNNGGADVVLVTGPGTYTVGPFLVNTPVTLFLANDENPLCTVVSPALVNPVLCPVLVPCGDDPLDYDYCYGNNDSHEWSWAATSEESLIIIFSAGTIESSTWDHLRIYEGEDNNGTLLYENPSGTTDLTGLQVTSPSGQIYMEMSSDGSGSCVSSSSYDAWQWQVGCLDCTAAQATYNVVTACDDMEYRVEVNILVLGSDPTLEITNDNGAETVVAMATGTYSVGPFPAGTPTVITLVNSENSLCNVSSEVLINPLCPTIVECGSDAINESYCYENNDDHAWHWKASGNHPLVLQFSQGTIESSTWDKLRIYNGPDNNSPLLWQHTQTSQFNLSGLELISTGTEIYMEMTSDASSSCASNSQTEWHWEVGCLDCTNPAATFSMVEDCVHHSFSIAVDVDSLGSGNFVRISNSLSSDTLSNILTGINMVGPFPMDSAVVLTVMNETNNLCRVSSNEFTSSWEPCVQEVCEVQVFDYCYANSDTAWFAYRAPEGIPLTIEFLRGAMGPDDYIQVFNGIEPVGAPLYQGNVIGDLTGLAINTTGNNNTMLLRVVSNDSYSCASGEISPPMRWTVQCGMVGIEEMQQGSFAMYPNPTRGEFTIQLPEGIRGNVELTVVDPIGRTVHQQTITTTLNRIDLQHVQSGFYTVRLQTDQWAGSKGLQIVR